MNKVLIAHEKHGDRGFDGSTKGLVEDALLKLFKERQEEGWYEFRYMDARMKKEYQKAKKGDKKAIVQFMSMRHSYEYEEVDIVKIEEACD